MLGVIIASVLFGVLLCLILQFLLLRRWFLSLPFVKPPKRAQYEQFKLPKELQDIFSDPELMNKKEACSAVNLIFHFLFGELKDTKRFRRWVMKRMNNEFKEMMQTTTGKLLDQITVRDFTLGETFPIFDNVVIESVNCGSDQKFIEELTLLLDITYNGGFELAIDVDLVFGRSAFLCVKVLKVKGTGRLQFSRQPFTHWSFAFIEDPILEFNVDSHFDGRPVPQVTTFIMNLIRRSIRKKHTLPNYKIRYRPFFIKPEPKPAAKDIVINGSKLSVGQLEVKVLECRRLVKVNQDSFIYCTLAIDSLPWIELMSTRRKLWVSHEIDILKGNAQNIGLYFKEDFIAEKFETQVVVDSILANSPAAKTNIKKNDIVIAVNHTKVSRSRMAAKLIKQAGERVILRIERSTAFKSLSQPEFRFEEDMVSLRQEDVEGLNNDEDNDEFINISIAPASSANDDPKPAVCESSNESSPSKNEPSNLNLPTSAAPGMMHSMASSSDGLFHRKKSKLLNYESPKGSPEVLRKFSNPEYMMGNTESVETSTMGGKSAVTSSLDRKPRSKSDATPVIKIGNEEADVSSIIPPPAIDENCDDTIDLKKTKLIKASQEPQFNETFYFDVQEEHAFLNVCVWCRIPEKLDKQNRVVKPEKDVLIGHVSIPLMDLALDCMTTLQGDCQQTFTLTPAELKVTASRAKMSNLASHPGFDPLLCYGDVTLAFEHHTQELSKAERKLVLKVGQDNEQKQEQQELLKSEQAQAIPKPSEDGRHNFLGKNFQSATYCNFCHKKIWLKAAFQCCVCGMKCHKKCTDKCQAQTLCTKDGFKYKNPSEFPSIPNRRSSRHSNSDSQMSGDCKPAGKPDDVTSVQMVKTSFLSKFRKSKDSPDKSLSVQYNRGADHRRKSEGSGSELLGVAGEFPRTRSSISIGDLLKDNASPSLSAEEASQANLSSSESESTDDEDEQNLMRFLEQKGSTQNADDVALTIAKEMGRELYLNMAAEERKEKLESMVLKLQQQIDNETENRSDLTRLEASMKDPLKVDQIRAKIDKSDEKIQSMALLMLHYCAGLQHCNEEETEGEKEEMDGQTLDGEDELEIEIEEMTGETAEHEDMKEDEELKVEPEEEEMDDNIPGTAAKITLMPEVPAISICSSSTDEASEGGATITKEDNQASVGGEALPPSDYQDVVHSGLTDGSELVKDESTGNDDIK